jgi:hypothetical protein
VADVIDAGGFGAVANASNFSAELRIVEHVLDLAHARRPIAEVFAGDRAAVFLAAFEGVAELAEAIQAAAQIAGSSASAALGAAAIRARLPSALAVAGFAFGIVLFRTLLVGGPFVIDVIPAEVHTLFALQVAVLLAALAAARLLAVLAWPALLARLPFALGLAVLLAFAALAWLIASLTFAALLAAGLIAALTGLLSLAW